MLTETVLQAYCGSVSCLIKYNKAESGILSALFFCGFGKDVGFSIRAARTV